MAVLALELRNEAFLLSDSRDLLRSTINEKAVARVCSEIPARSFAIVLVSLRDLKEDHVSCVHASAKILFSPQAISMGAMSTVVRVGGSL